MVQGFANNPAGVRRLRGQALGKHPWTGVTDFCSHGSSVKSAPPLSRPIGEARHAGEVTGSPRRAWMVRERRPLCRALSQEVFL